MSNPYTFVNWGLLGISEKSHNPTQRMPGYKISIGEIASDWSGYGLDTLLTWILKPKEWHSARIINKRNLGYATPTEAREFFTAIINKIESKNAITPVKRRKIRFLKSLSHEPDWRKMEGGMITYAFYTPSRWGWEYPANHRIFIHFQPYHPPKPKKVKTFAEKVRKLNYNVYGL
jgi:hypothetical protein